MAKPRVVYIHGNSTTHWSHGWAAWFKAEVERLGFDTFFETMPDSIIARAEYWLSFLQDPVKVGGGDVVVGWSSGAVAAMRYAELERQSGYYSAPWQWEAIKQHQKKIAVISGDDDPWIPQDQFSFIAEKLGAEHISVPGGKHFIDIAEFPVLLEYFKREYASS
jgi:predicted alpha/beta hydrolase family esterase